MGKMHQAGLMLRNSNMTRYLACWRAMAEARAEQFRKLRVAAGRMCNRLLAMCFGACMELVAAKHQREETALQCVRRMLNRVLVMAWGAWWGKVVLTDAKAAVKCAVQHRNGKVSDGVDAVAAAKAYAVLVASGMAGSPEAAMLTAYFTRMHG